MAETQQTETKRPEVNMSNYVVVMERKDKTAIVVMRNSDYLASVSRDHSKVRYGSGVMWTVLSVMDQEAYQNRTDSKPFRI